MVNVLHGLDEDNLPYDQLFALIEFWWMYLVTTENCNILIDM